MYYKASWNSLVNHSTPQWLRDGKFGIYTHWGVYSVPACGPNVSWYPYNMYRPGTAQYEFHLKNYGGPKKFGYKDFIPQFTGSKFDPEQWAEIFKDSGAAFAGPVAEHHDGFALWDTKYSEWNSVKMGPKRDVVALLEKSIRSKGMKFMIALHHAENWKFFPHWIKDYDTCDPKYAGLYGEAHNMELDVLLDSGWEGEFQIQDNPNKAFLEMWQNKCNEVVDKFKPDMLWFDFGLEFIQEHYKREMIAYYYNAAREWSKDVVLAYKMHHVVPGSGIEDVEQGGAGGLRYNEWLTDSTVDDGCGWGYMRDCGYKSSESLIWYLIDNVSKNGYLLLNVGPKADGSIPQEAQDVLKDMGKWLRVNGEAIYGTTPWLTYGEGTTKIKAGPMQESSAISYTSKDIRFTCKDDSLYAILLSWPNEKAVIESCKNLYPGEIEKITMLGCDIDLRWKMTQGGLEVAVPKEKPCESAYVLKIKRKRPF